MNTKLLIENELADLSLYYWSDDDLIEVAVKKKEDCYLNINKAQAIEIVDFLTDMFKIEKI